MLNFNDLSMLHTPKHVNCNAQKGIGETYHVASWIKAADVNLRVLFANYDCI